MSSSNDRVDEMGGAADAAQDIAEEGWSVAITLGKDAPDTNAADARGNVVPDSPDPAHICWDEESLCQDCGRPSDHRLCQRCFVIVKL